MTVLTGGSFKEIAPQDIQNRTTTLNQLVDVIQEDVSGSATRKAYQVFVTGGIGPGVTSSLYQTVFDQDFTLQTANPIFDVTIGLEKTSSTVVDIATEDPGSGKLLFPSQSLMMREKIDNYRQFAANLLGDSNKKFAAPFGSTTAEDEISEAIFISFKRLFARDQIKRETFAIRLFQSASQSSGSVGRDGSSKQRDLNGFGTDASSVVKSIERPKSNIRTTSEQGAAIFTDIGAASAQRRDFGGEVGNIVNAANTSKNVGLIFYESGTVILDAAKVFSGSQHISGTIAAITDTLSGIAAGDAGPDGVAREGSEALAAGLQCIGSVAGNPNAKLIPDLFVSASIDDIVDHLCSTRFSSGSLTAMTFQNSTQINSTLYFCRASADEFNYSSNPTYSNTETGRIEVIDVGQESTQRSFTFPTTVGLHDSRGRLLAVAKMSRPIEKNDEKDITFRVRLDF